MLNGVFSFNFNKVYMVTDDSKELLVLPIDDVTYGIPVSNPCTNTGSTVEPV